MFEELGLSSLQVVGWQMTFEFWNKTASSPIGPLFKTILLDNIDDAFPAGDSAKNFSDSKATCLHSIGQPMHHDRGVIPVWRLVQL